MKSPPLTLRVALRLLTERPEPRSAADIRLFARIGARLERLALTRLEVQHE